MMRMRIKSSFILAAWIFCVAIQLALSQIKLQKDSAQWISASGTEPCPVNRFFYFRKVARLQNLRGDMTLYVGADSNAHVWINGHIVLRKVTRYFENHITTEAIDAKPFLRRGLNTVVILNHTWGNITTFQRSGCAHAGIWVSSSWLVSNNTWKFEPAPEFAPNDLQIRGVTQSNKSKGDPRIRFAQFLYGDKLPQPAMFSEHFDDSTWLPAETVLGGPWPEHPSPAETPAQREVRIRPILVLAQGNADEHHVEANDPIAISHSMLLAHYEPKGKRNVALSDGIFKTQVIRGRAGETKYVTFDFGKPVHGFPYLTATALKAKPSIDFGYGELNDSPSSGKFLVDATGWLDPGAIVGKGYVDRYYVRNGSQHFELPDERTARWWTIHIYFPEAGEFILRDAGFISSQYPVRLRGSFRCGDKRIDQIVRLSLEHAMVSMSDTYVDTPGREDGQWLEDARLRAQLAAQWFGDVKLRQVLLRLAAQSQTTNGHLHPFPPSNYPITANADWAAEWVGALYDDYLWTGETARVRQYWPQVVAWWNTVLQNVDAHGLWRDNRVFADIRIGVHPAPGQSSGIASAQIIQRLSLSIAMAKAIDENDQAAKWQKSYEVMRSAFRKDHIIAGTNDVPLHVDDVADPTNSTVRRGYSQAAQAMAVESGLLNQTEAIESLDHAFPAPDGSPSAGVDRWNNPTYLYRSLDALTIAGFSNRAVRHLLERFAPYLPGDPHNPNPLVLQGRWGGPLPEYWISRKDLKLPDDTLNPAQPIDPSGSHGWNSVALVWLHDSLLGVTIASPGGARIRIHPDAAGLRYVEGTTVTPKGDVFISWKPWLPSLLVRIPAGTEAEIVLPAKLVDLVSNGRLRIPPNCRAENSGEYICRGQGLVFSVK